jgi:hypothetical protein
MRTCEEVAMVSVGEGTSRGAGKVVAAFAPAATPERPPHHRRGKREKARKRGGGGGEQRVIKASTSDSGGHGMASNIYKNAEVRSSGVGSR